MKKIKVLVLVLAMMMVFVSSAQAISIGSVNYEDGKVRWSVSDFDVAYDVYVDGSHLVNVDSGSASYNKTLSAGSHTLKVVDINNNVATKDFPVGGAVDEPKTEEPEETPTPTPTPTATPTATPTVTPTATPVEPSSDPTTVAPTTVAPVTSAPATAKPTKAPSTNNSDVPKTGDATTTFMFVIVAMMALAAGALTAMRVVSRKK